LQSFSSAGALLLWSLRPWNLYYCCGESFKKQISEFRGLTADLGIPLLLESLKF
jgi:hypothetical protein